MDYRLNGVLTPLSGKVLEVFNDEKERVRDNLIRNKKARRFFSDRDMSTDEMLVVLDRLVPIDGERSNLAVSKCGIISGVMNNAPVNNFVIKNFPFIEVCTGIGLESTRYNVYFFKKSGVQAMHILHELAHATYKLTDTELAKRIGFMIPGGEGFFDTTAMSKYLARECLAI